MKTILTLVTMLIATAAAAHPGHIAPEAGHGHTEIIALLAIVGIAGVLWSLRSR